MKVLSQDFFDAYQTDTFSLNWKHSTRIVHIYFLSFQVI